MKIKNAHWIQKNEGQGDFSEKHISAIMEAEARIG